MRSRLYFKFALRIQFPSANEKIRICRCVKSVSGNENGLPSIKEEEGKNLYIFYISHFVALTRETIIKNRVQVKFEPYVNRKQCGEKPVLDGAFR